MIAPATANILAKLARGIADDFLTTLYLATTAPVIVAPAMNVNMWEHAATQENIEMLRARGVHIVAPDEGYLACGMTGAGRLAGVEAIAHAVCDALGHPPRPRRRDRAGHRRAHLRRSRSGSLSHQSLLRQMGYALADAAARRGARVVLVSGPTALDAPAGVERISRAQRRRDASRGAGARLTEATIVIMAAAVADYRPVAPQASKIKRGARPPASSNSRPPPDILADVASRRKGAARIVVGFAAETDHVAEHARRKLAAKAADLIVANDVTAEGAGFDHDTNVVTLFTRDGGEDSSAADEQIRRGPAHPRSGSGLCAARPRSSVAPDARERMVR